MGTQNFAFPRCWGRVVSSGDPLWIKLSKAVLLKLTWGLANGYSRLKKKVFCIVPSISRFLNKTDWRHCFSLPSCVLNVPYSLKNGTGAEQPWVNQLPHLVPSNLSLVIQSSVTTVSIHFCIFLFKGHFIHWSATVLWAPFQVSPLG